MISVREESLMGLAGSCSMGDFSVGEMGERGPLLLPPSFLKSVMPRDGTRGLARETWIRRSTLSVEGALWVALAIASEAQRRSSGGMVRSCKEKV